MSQDNLRASGGLRPQHQTYKQQKCFIAFSQSAAWRDDLMVACQEVLRRPAFDLTLDYAGRNFDPDVTLREKALELIANARYGIYDLSYWQDEHGAWHMPRNVFIELGMAIALNRPTLLLRHANNKDLEVPEYLKSMGGLLLEFSGETTLKAALSKRLPLWLEASPERDWWNRFCIFGNRVCEYREAHPRSRRWGRETLYCQISDGPDPDREDFRGLLEEVLCRFSDIEYTYLDTVSFIKGYDLLLCSHCQNVRSTSFAVFRITPYTPAETFIAIGMIIALEKQFDYKVPKLLLTENVHELPSLLTGYEAVVARSDKERKEHLRSFIPAVMQKVRQTTWKPRPLPFLEIEIPNIFSEEPGEPVVKRAQTFFEQGVAAEQAGQYEDAVKFFNKAIEDEPDKVSTYVRLATLLSSLNRLAEAEEVIYKTLTIDPQNAAIFNLLTQILILKGDPESFSLRTDNIGVLLGVAETAYGVGNFAGAEKAFAQAVKLFPDSEVAYSGLASALKAQGEFHMALEVYAQIINRFPLSSVGNNGLADTLRALRRFGDSLKAYDHTISLFPDDVVARTGRAEVLAGMGRVDEAEAAYWEILNRLPDNEAAQSGLARLLKEQASEAIKPVRIFYSYSAEDEMLRDELEKHLTLLSRQGIIDRWHDRLINVGSEWDREISEHLDAADIILLLLSADYLASDYCYGVEMQRAIELHHAGDARVIPVILRPCDWRHEPFASLQALPSTGVPVTRWRFRDEAFLNIAVGIRKAIGVLRKRQSLSS